MSARHPSPQASSAQLIVDGISVVFDARRVLTDVSFVVPPGTTVGLIGENGSGKSTLLRVIAGLLEPTAGSVTAVAQHGGPARIGLLHQQPPFAETATVAEAIEESVAPARAASAAITAAAERLAAHPGDETAARSYTLALEAADHLDVWETDARIATMLAGLGLDGVPRDRATSSLSGGQRARLSLAWVLLARPDVLLLDEPTNHLDDAATTHLCSVLADWRGPVLLASHDRAFLDEAVTALVDLDPSPLPRAVSGSAGSGETGSGGGVTRFSGTYTDYLHHRRQIRERWVRRYEEEQAERSRLRASVRDNQVVGRPERGPRSEARVAKKFYADRNAKVVSRRVNEARVRLEDLEAHQVRRPPRELSFGGIASGLSAPGGSTSRHSRSEDGPVLVASEVSVEGRLRSTSLAVGGRDRWLLTGPNGSGKSTLLNLLAGRLSPDSGSLTLRPGLRVGLLAQEVTLPGPRRRSAAEIYAATVGPRRAQEFPLAAHGLLTPRDETRPAGSLSVGQQRRLALACLLAWPPDVLLLDEPTNHLSLRLATELEAALTAYPGAVVVASHDRWLRRRWTGPDLALG